jgi:hypothetical protein
MILDMSPTTTGLLQQNDVATYAAFGKGLQSLYNGSSVVGESEDGSIARGNSVVVVPLRTVAFPVRGAIEIRENLTLGQAVANYTVERCVGTVAAAATSGGTGSTFTDAGCTKWEALPLRNELQLTIGNRRIQYWSAGDESLSATPASVDAAAEGSAPAAATPQAVRLTVATLKLASGVAAVPHLRSVRIFDWSPASFDPLVAQIIRVP